MGRVHAQADMCQTVRQACDGCIKTRRARVLGQDGLMVLTSARNQSGHSRGSYALPDVARKVDQTGSSVAFFLRHTDIRSHRERDEQERNRQILPDANPRGSLKADE